MTCGPALMGFDRRAVGFSEFHLFFNHPLMVRCYVYRCASRTTSNQGGGAHSRRGPVRHSSLKGRSSSRCPMLQSLFGAPLTLRSALIAAMAVSFIASAPAGTAVRRSAALGAGAWLQGQKSRLQGQLSVSRHRHRHLQPRLEQFAARWRRLGGRRRRPARLQGRQGKG